MKKGAIVLLAILSCVFCFSRAGTQEKTFEEHIRPFLSMQIWPTRVVETNGGKIIAYMEIYYHQNQKIMAKEIATLSGIPVSLSVHREDGTFRVVWEYCGHVNKLPD